MLLALCHRCWTWMEPKHERCVECGGGINLHDPDPPPEDIRKLFGVAAGILGEASLKRPRLPSFGTLSSFENGLLFLPDLRELPTGGLAAVEGNHGRGAGSSPIGFWSLFSRRTAPEKASTPEARPPLTEDESVTRFVESPGALFVHRESIHRIVHRGTLLRVERKPGRTVAFRVESARRRCATAFAGFATAPVGTPSPCRSLDEKCRMSRLNLEHRPLAKRVFSIAIELPRMNVGRFPADSPRFPLTPSGL